MSSVYKQIAKANSDIITLDDLKLYLKIDQDEEDDILTVMLNAAIKTAEKLTNIDLLETTYENYRDTLNGDLTLRRGKFNSLSKIELLVDGVYEEVDAADYEVIDNEVFGEVVDNGITDNSDISHKAVKITFKTGFSATGSLVPDDLRTAIMQHVASMYENRGDFDTADAMHLLPLTAKLIYQNNLVIDISI